MKLFAMVLPALMIGSMALAQGGTMGGAPATSAPAAGDSMAAAPKSAKEAKKACKEKANGDKKVMKQCMKDYKASQSK